VAIFAPGMQKYGKMIFFKKINWDSKILCQCFKNVFIDKNWMGGL
jgi:hypothetical protein